MDLEYLIESNNINFAKLVNFCLKAKNSETEKVDIVTLNANPYNIDELGNRYLLVKTFKKEGNVIKYISRYTLNDYEMKEIKANLDVVDYSEELHCYMVKEFGFDYVCSLHTKRLEDADREFEKLVALVPSFRK